MKRDIKQQAKQAHNTILDENKDWYNNVMEQHFSNNEKQEKEKQNRKKRTLWLSLSSSLASVLIVIVSLIVLWPTLFPPDSPPTPTPNPPKKSYLAENERAKEIGLDDINDSLKDISVIISSIYDTKIELIYDLLSEDTLCYKFHLVNEDVTYETIFLYLYTNPDYLNRIILPEKSKDEVKSDLINGFSVSYNEDVQDEGWAFRIKVFAKTVYNDIEIYVSYEQLSEDENCDFFPFFEQTIKKS